jgi:hypothetical protein
MTELAGVNCKPAIGADFTTSLATPPSTTMSKNRSPDGRRSPSA